MDPAEALANTDQRDDTPAPLAAAWLADPARPTRHDSGLQKLLDEISRGDFWDAKGVWQGKGPEPTKETETP